MINTYYFEMERILMMHMEVVQYSHLIRLDVEIEIKNESDIIAVKILVNYY